MQREVIPSEGLILPQSLVVSIIEYETKEKLETFKYHGLLRILKRTRKVICWLELLKDSY